jgi:hypothetical protein
MQKEGNRRNRVKGVPELRPLQKRIDQNTKAGKAFADIATCWICSLHTPDIYKSRGKRIRLT